MDVGGLGVAVGGRGVGVAEGVGVGVAVGVSVGVLVGVLEGVEVDVREGVGAGVSVGTSEAVGVAVRVYVAVGSSVGVKVGRGAVIRATAVGEGSAPPQAAATRVRSNNGKTKQATWVRSNIHSPSEQVALILPESAGCQQRWLG